MSKQTLKIIAIISLSLGTVATILSLVTSGPITFSVVINSFARTGGVFILGLYVLTMANKKETKK